MDRKSEEGKLKNQGDFFRHLEMLRNIDWSTAYLHYSLNGNLVINTESYEIVYDLGLGTIHSSVVNMAPETVDKNRRRWNENVAIVDRINEQLAGEDFMQGMADGAFLVSARLEIVDIWVVLRLEFKDDSPIAALNESYRLAGMDGEISAENILTEIYQGRYKKRLSDWKYQEVISILDADRRAYEEALKATGIFEIEGIEKDFTPQENIMLSMVRSGKYEGIGMVPVTQDFDSEGYINITQGSMKYTYFIQMGKLVDSSKDARDALIAKCSVYVENYPKYMVFEEDMRTRLLALGLKPKTRMVISGGMVSFAVHASTGFIQINGQISSKALKKDRDVIIKRAKTAINAEKKERAARERAADAVYAQNPLFGSYLTESIVRLVSANANNISYGEVVRALTGQELKTNSQLILLDEYGKYAIIEPTEVNKNLVMCVNQKLLEEILIECDDSQRKVLRPVRENIERCMKMDKPANFGKNKTYAKYRDNDWGAYIEFTNPGDIKNVSYWKRLLPLLDRQTVYCAKKESFTAFFDGAPENVKEYIRVSRMFADGAKRRMLDELVEGMGQTRDTQVPAEVMDE